MSVRPLLLTAPALLAAAPASATAIRPTETTAEVTAVAPTRDAALRQAITLGIDALLAQAVTPGSPAAQRIRQALPDAQARIVRIRREGTTPQGYTVTAVIALPAGTVERAVIAQTPELAQLRIAVLIPESILRRPVPDPAAETELARALLGAGLGVVDLPTTLQGTDRDLAQSAALDDAARRALQARLGADLLVTGEAFAEEYGAVTSTRAYTSRLEVKVIDLSTGQVLYSQALQASGIGATDAVAGKTALMNAGIAAGAVLPGALLRALESGAPARPRAYVVRIQAPVTFERVDALRQALGTQDGVSGAHLRTLDAAGAVLDVTFTGTAGALATRLTAAGTVVIGISGLDVTVHF